MGEIRKIIAQNLRNVCKAKHIRQIDVAKALGVSQGSVANWLNGVNGIDVENLCYFCQYAGISLNEVFGLEKSTGGVTVKEMNLINVFRCLNGAGMQKVIEYAEDMADTRKYSAYSGDDLPTLEEAQAFIESRRVDSPADDRADA